MLRRTNGWPLLLALAIAGFATTARADPPSAAGSHSDAEVQRRIRFIEERVDDGTAAADRWWYAWFSIYTGLTVGQAAIAIAATDPGLRIDNAVGALTSSLGVVPLGLIPFEARFAAEHRISRSTPFDPPARSRRYDAKPPFDFAILCPGIGPIHRYDQFITNHHR